MNVGALLERQAQQQVAANITVGECRAQGLVEYFLKFKPPKFTGMGDPKEAKS